MTPRHLLEPGRLAGTALLKAQSDSRLMDLTRAGNDRAFEAIVARYRAPLARYCSRILPDGRGEDALQQTFLKAYNALHGDTTPLSLRAWLFGIAHNVSLNMLRQRGSDHEPLEADRHAHEAADAAVESRERFREVLAAVAALPAAQRDALLLRELEGRGHEDIARELGITGGAARQLISRARNGIRHAAAAVLPMPLVMRATEGAAAPPTAERVAELTAVGAGITVTKLVATAAVGGTLIGGAATTGPRLVDGDRDARPPGAAEAARADTGRDADAPASGARAIRDRDSDRRDYQDRARRDGDDYGSERDGDDRDARGRRDDDGDNSDDGSGRSDREREDRLGSSGRESREPGDDDEDYDERDDADADSGSESGEDDSDALSDNSGPGSGGDSDARDLVEPDDDAIEAHRVDRERSRSGSGDDD